MPPSFRSFRFGPLFIGMGMFLACVNPAFAEEWEADSDSVSPTRFPCSDEGWEGVDFFSGLLSPSARVAGADCDPEQIATGPQDVVDEALLFQSDSDEAEFLQTRSSTVLSISRSSTQNTRSILRTRGVNNGWEHRMEVRGDSLTRRRLGWSGHGWKLLGGDLTDAKLSLWPNGLPHRTLPVGWTPAHADDAASALPQGLAAGVQQDGWSSYALRAWNPVETGREPPWQPAWNLRHAAAGASFKPAGLPAPLSGTLMIHLSETRITRGNSDTLSERLAAAGFSSAAFSGNTFALQVARTESDRAARSDAGNLYALQVRHRFDDDADLTFSMRQRDRGWRSAWDPALSAEEVYAVAPDSEDPSWGAGEARLSGKWSIRPAPATASQRPARETRTVRGEIWRVWNPEARTTRQGVRATTTSRRNDLRLDLDATFRSRKTATGPTQLYRYFEAGSQLESFPHWRVAVWRAWNTAGPLRTGGFLGAEPAWGALRLTPGMRLETDAEDRLEGIARLGLRWRGSTRWIFDAAVTVPCWPAGNRNALQGGITIRSSGP